VGDRVEAQVRVASPRDVRALLEDVVEQPTTPAAKKRGIDEVTT